MKIDDKDREILRVLQQEGRLTNQALAERVNLSPSPCLRRVRILEAAGVVAGYGARINAQSVGLGLTAFVQIRLEGHSQAAVRDFEAAMADIPEVLDAYLMSGEADYLLRVVAADLRGFETFVRDKLQAVPGIASIHSSFAIGVVKADAPLPV